MRRFAGSFVRRKHNESLLPIAAGGGVLVGPWLGYMLHQVIAVWLDDFWGSAVFGIAVLVVAAAFWTVFRGLERAHLRRLEKGEDAELRAEKITLRHRRWRSTRSPSAANPAVLEKT